MPGRLNVAAIDAGWVHISVRGQARGYAADVVALNSGPRVISATHSGRLRAKPLIQTAGARAQADTVPAGGVCCTDSEQPGGRPGLQQTKVCDQPSGERRD